MLKWDTPKTCPLHRYEMTKKKKDPLYNGGLQQGQPLWKVLSALHRNDDLELVWEWFWLKSFLYRALVGGAFIRNTFKENCLVLGWCLDINNKKKIKCFDSIFGNVLYNKKVNFGKVIYQVIVDIFKSNLPNTYFFEESSQNPLKWALNQ